MKFPIPKKIAHTLELHNHKRIDNYFWMRDRENPDVIAHLEAENKYTESVMAPTKKLQEELFQEMKGRIKEDDASPPYFKNGYWYYTRYETGSEYPIYCRKKKSLEATEEIILDENLEADNYSYYEVVALSVARNNKLMAFAEDISGRSMYQIRFKNLETGEILPYCIENCGSDMAWHNDNKTLYFSQNNTETLRTYLVQTINIETGQIEIIYEEKDDAFIISIDKTGNFKYIFIGSHSTLSNEFRFKSSEDGSPFKIFIPRSAEHTYYPESTGDHFFIKTNRNAKNFKIVLCTANQRDEPNWTVVQPHNANVLIEDFELFDTHLVVQEKENGLSQLRVYDRKDLSQRIIPPKEETYTLYLGMNPESASKTVRIGYTSMTTPYSVYDIDLASFEQKLIKQLDVLGGFDVNDYHSERIWATAKDGVKVPISLVYKKEFFKKEGEKPLLLYAYGAYGSTIDPYFSSTRLSLLNRGFVFAIAHVRGGEYLGTKWYEAGKLLKKKNTFTDFIAVAETLIDLKYAAKDSLFAMGGSAGGLLTGAVANLRPDLWKGVIMQVPFVDVVSTMIDETIPLTTGEYDEWGNPNQKEFYDLILSYSPYDQIEGKAYPNMLVTSGLHDSQVQFWEPTKYVAKLRELKTDQNLVLLQTNMDAGHGGAAGRFQQLREVAEEYAFILMLQNG